MADTMCAVQIKYGAFTDYFLAPNLVIQILEDVAMDSVDESTQQLSVPWDRLAAFLQLGDEDAVAHVRADGVDLRDVADDQEAPGGWFAEWGRTSDFLTWLQNMQAMLESGELQAFLNPRDHTVTFDFS